MSEMDGQTIFGMIREETRIDILNQILKADVVDIKTCETINAILQVYQRHKTVNSRISEEIRMAFHAVLKQLLLPYLVEATKISNLVQCPENMNVVFSPIGFEHWKTAIKDNSRPPDLALKTSQYLKSEISVFISVIDLCCAAYEVLQSYEMHVHRDCVNVMEMVFCNINKSLHVIMQDIPGIEEKEISRKISLSFAHLMKIMKLLKSDCTNEIIEDIIKCSNHIISLSHDIDIVACILSLIIAPYLEVYPSKTHTMIYGLWGMMKTFYVVEEGFVIKEINDTGYLILCFISRYIFEGEPHHLLLEPIFWQVIEYGLIHNNPLTRKRSQYILKRALDVISEQKIQATYPEYMIWDVMKSKEIEEIWHEYFLMIETLEEKQVHVIKPILGKISTMLLSCCQDNGISKMHITWPLMIYKRLFDQDNKNLKQWALLNLLETNFPMDSSVKYVKTFFRFYVLKLLSDYAMYMKSDCKDTPGFIVQESLSGFLLQVLNNRPVEEQSEFLSSFLGSVFDGRAWGGVPLFCIQRAIVLLPSYKVLSPALLEKSANELEICLATHEQMLRSASQCDFIKIVLKHSKVDITMVEFCKILCHFKLSESWARGTKLWDIIIEFFSSRLSKDCDTSLHEYIEKTCISLQDDGSLSPYAISIGISLYLDMNCRIMNPRETQQKLVQLLESINDVCENCHIRPYQNKDRISAVISVFSHTLEILGSTKEKLYDYKDNEAILCKALLPSFAPIIKYGMNDIRRFTEPYSIYSVITYINLFTKMVKFDLVKKLFEDDVDLMIDLVEELLGSSNYFRKCCGLLMLEFMYTDQLAQNKSSTERLESLVHTKVLQNLSSLLERKQHGGEEKEHWNTITLKTVEAAWNCTEAFVSKYGAVPTSNKESQHISPIDLQQAALVHLVTHLPEVVDTVSRTTAVQVFQITVSLAPLTIQEGIWEVLCASMWKAAYEYRRSSDLFRKLVSIVCEYVFHPSNLREKGNLSYMIKMGEQLLREGELIKGIVNNMALKLVVLLCQIEDSELLISSGLIKLLLIPTLMFGASCRKQLRVSEDAIDFIQSCEDEYSTNGLIISEHDSSRKARAISLRFLLALDVRDSNHCLLAQHIVMCIKQAFDEIKNLRTREFANSQAHRYKTRLLQALLVLLPLLHQEDCRTLLQWLSEELTRENQQPSVRYMEEWGLALIVILHPDLHSEIFECSAKGTQKRPGCIGSFIAAITQVACVSKDDHLLMQALEYTLPWCMAQHFNTRLYAQVALQKIWNHCKEFKLNNILERYGPVQSCLQFVVEQGNAARNTQNMLNDFFFKIFEPINHYTLQTIFYNLPQLSMLAREEWISPAYLQGVASDELLPLLTTLPLRNNDLSLDESEPAPWVLKAAGIENEKDQQWVQVSNIQKKIMPWKSMMSELFYPINTSAKGDHVDDNHGNLVLVASLVDKAPNLGGLCRTCEVFSVQEYVIPNCAILEDQMFNSLSVTAQQWVPIKEVKPEELVSYLQTLQGHGYTLVGAEQTSNSVSLATYKFPKKTVVILGNEREGIPCDVIQLLDVCIEIPQTGIIRSLNVHVSGALFIWEYTRQHLIKNLT